MKRLGGTRSGAARDASTAIPPAVAHSRFARGGKGETIGFTAASTPFGWMVAGATGQGLCWLALAHTQSEAVAALHAAFSAAMLRRDSSLKKFLQAALDSVREPARGRRAPVPLDLRGTEFQLRVWQALCKIPRGQTRSYAQLARAIGNPQATRAVARACAANRVAILVPCHRIVGADGALTGYRWGVERKQSLLRAEGATVRPSSRFDDK